MHENTKKEYLLVYGIKGENAVYRNRMSEEDINELLENPDLNGYWLFGHTGSTVVLLECDGIHVRVEDGYFLVGDIPEVERPMMAYVDNDGVEVVDDMFFYISSDVFYYQDEDKCGFLDDDKVVHYVDC